MSPAAAQPLRVPIDRQILRQAPPGAVGYRLALPGRTHAEKSKIIPGADATGAPRCWSLHPFQLPDDLRLRDGHAYRILWVDAQGAAIPPQGTAQLPALRFFLGPADAESVEEDAAFADILRDVTDAKQRALIEAEVARERLMLIRLRARTEDARRQVVIGEASVRNMKAQFEVTSEIARKTAEEAERRKAKEREERAKQEEERQRSDQQGLLITAGVTAVVGLITWLGYKAFGPNALQARAEQAELAELAEQAEQTLDPTKDAVAGSREAVAAPEPAVANAAPTAASSPSSVTTAAPRMSAAMPATPPVAAAASAAAGLTPSVTATTPGAPTAAQTPRSAPAVSGAPSATAIPALVGAASSGAVATTSTPPSGSTASSTALPTPPGFDTLTAEQQAAFRRLGTDLTFRYAFFAELMRACDPDLGSVLDTAEEMAAPTAADQQQIRSLLALEPCARAIQEYRRDAGASRASALAPSRLSAQADAGIAEGSDAVAAPVFQRPPSASTDGALADGESPLDALLGSQQPQGPCAGVAPTPGPEPEAQSHAPESVVADRAVAEIDTELHPTMDTSPEPETETADAYDLSLDDAVGTLDESERRQLCDIVLDSEKMAQFNYEACREEAIDRGEPPPPDLAIPLSDKERTTIQKARTDPRLSRALLALIIDFGNAQIDGADGMFKLAFPFKALKPEDIAWIRDAVATPARRTYYTYLRARHAALLEGNVPPPAPTLSLPSKEQRIVRRAANDLRAVTYLDSTTRAKMAAT
ncbi:MAG: hypothetical protein JNJ46_00785 [Myxococcales bacterium]|nr:hypothetical protein [Myxococcales bacterium]